MVTEKGRKTTPRRASVGAAASTALAVGIVAAALLWARALGAGENLVQNPRFEQGMSHWSVKLQGEWAKRAAPSSIVTLATDARTRKQALRVDTTTLNQRATITDELRTWRRPKYHILVTQKVTGIKPNAWYLATLHIRSPGIAIHTGLEYLLDIQPWPLRTYGKSEEKSHWAAIHAWERRLFLPQAPRTDDRSHPYVLLKQTYSKTHTLEVGVRIRAPWTGTILLDGVELIEVEPGTDLTKMAKLLALRGATPLPKARALNRDTVLVAGGRPAAAILVPGLEAYKRLGAKIQARIKELAGGELPVATRLADVPKGAAIVAVGSMLRNNLVARLHFNRYVRVDAASPGPGAYVHWTVAEPYGLARKQNVVVVAGSDAAGEAAAVEAFCALLEADGRSLRVPYLHTVHPRRTIPPGERAVPRKRWGFHIDRNRFAGFSKWHLSKWLETGDLEVARLARDEILMVADRYLENPYFQTAWDTYEVGWAWDSLEEAPVFSDADRLKITNMLLAYLHMRPQMTSDWSRMVPDLAVNPTWNHQAKGLSGVYTMARYFKRFYPDADARCDYYLASARNAFRQQARWAKPQENAGNYWLITMRFAIAWYLGEWDMTFFENGALRRYAEYFPVVCNNQGWIAGFGDTYYCYHGAAPRAISGTGIGDPSLAFWYYRDGRIHWWLEHCKFEGYRNLYYPDVEPVEWKELLGVKRVPLEKGLYDPRRGLQLWGSGGDSTHEPVGDVKYEETFDKISFRDTWDPKGQYLLLEGNGRGIHSGKATNQICKLSLLGEDLLIGSTYQGNNVRTNDTVIVARNAHINDAAVKGKNKYSPWQPLWRQYPAYAALDAMADLPTTGFTRTSLRGHLGGTDWHRNVFWLKGQWFALLDEVVAKEPGTYYIEANLRTCPKAKRNYPRMTPRTWKLLDTDRGLEQAFKDDGKTKLYILTDGTAKIATEVAPANYITTLMVRQLHERTKLAAGEKVTFIDLFYGDTERARANYRLERLSPTEGLILKNGKPVAYFGSGQGEKGRAALPIQARMFLLADDTLALVDGTAAGPHFKSDTPVSRELRLPPRTASDILATLARP